MLTTALVLGSFMILMFLLIGGVIGYLTYGYLATQAQYSMVPDHPEFYDEDGNMIHRGISKRMFSRSFTIANDVEVKGAELKDGLLKVSLERIIPEHKKAKTIEIK